MEKPFELSIITVNYNGIADTKDLIDSLQKNISTPYELIMVDNGSDVDEATLLKKQFPFIQAIRSEQNLGFSGGNNLGIRRAKGSFLLLINNDTFIRDDSILHLIETLKRNPNLGGVSPKILFADQAEGIQFAGYTQLSPITLRNRLIGYKEPDHGQRDRFSPTPYLHGAAMLVRKEAIGKAGLMPEVYFLYYEELDWSLQIRKSGYQLAYDPAGVVYHQESRSTGQESPLKTFYLTRNRLLFAKRNLNGLTRILSVCYQLCIANPKRIIQALLKGRMELVKAITKGILAYFQMK